MSSSEHHATMATMALAFCVLVFWWYHPHNTRTPQPILSDPLLTIAFKQMSPPTETPQAVSEVPTIPAIPALQPQPKKTSKPAVQKNKQQVSTVIKTATETLVTPVAELPTTTLATEQPKQAATAQKTTEHDPQLMARYRQALQALLSEHQDYPRLSRRLHEEGVVLVRFVVEASGKVTDIQLLTSSGFARLDQAAQTIFITLNRQVIPFLSGMPEQPLTFELPIRYTLTNTSVE
ncbi:MAG: energy transducer TonB [Proteobacteria bacterium]|nr:energy transducer TonB [Pseudomonadota bacterium]